MKRHTSVSYEEKIEAMAQDMVRLKNLSGETVQLDHFYRQLEKETQAHYQFMKVTKETCNDCSLQTSLETKQKRLTSISRSCWKSAASRKTPAFGAGEPVMENAAKEANDLRMHEEKELKLAAEHEQKAVDEAKTHEHDLLLSDAEKLANAPKPYKE